MPIPARPRPRSSSTSRCYREEHGGPIASWCANEKTAYEAALGTCFAGRRALVAMKHVGLNVAADAFINSALVHTHGGLVLAVADDPGMHSSQNEQDSRWYADFARVPCLEPVDAAGGVRHDARGVRDLGALRRARRPAPGDAPVPQPHDGRGAARAARENPIRRAANKNSWILLPANAREQWRELLGRQKDIADWSDESGWNSLTLNAHRTDLGVITTGIARNYLRENLDDLGWAPSHLHIGAYPAPPHLLRTLVGHVQRVLVLEDGQPFIERQLRGLFPPTVRVMGRMSGEVPETGELTPDDGAHRRSSSSCARRSTLEGLSCRTGRRSCARAARTRTPTTRCRRRWPGYEDPMVTADIGCYTLGALRAAAGDRVVRVHGRLDRHGARRGGGGRAPGRRGHRRQHVRPLRA